MKRIIVNDDTVLRAVKRLFRTGDHVNAYVVGREMLARPTWRTFVNIQKCLARLERAGKLTQVDSGIRGAAVAPIYTRRTS